MGLRGTGKTVLLNEVRDMTDRAGYVTSFIETPENNSLAELLYPQMRQTLRRLSVIEAARGAAITAMRALRGFASVFKISLGEVEIGVEPDPGIADSGNLENDLPEMFEVIGRAARDAKTGWALLIDEVQYITEAELAALILSVHRMAQRNLPVMVFAGGLPQIERLSGDAKSYAERLFIFPGIGPLSDEAARAAIERPLNDEGVSIAPNALDEILHKTKGYPFFLQEWGHHAWNAASQSPVSLADVRAATDKALAPLDNGFFRMRFDRLTRAEVDYVNAMASLGRGPYKVNDVAVALGKDPKALGPRRASIIRKGMIYAPSYGDIDFTVLLFDDFLRRTQA